MTKKIEEKLKKELAKRGLTLMCSPEKNSRLSSGQLVVFSAEQSKEDEDKKKPLIAGFRRGNSPDSIIGDYHNKFLEALEAVGIPRSSLYSTYPRVARGKIWPTFEARLTLDAFRELELISD